MPFNRCSFSSGFCGGSATLVGYDEQSNIIPLVPVILTWTFTANCTFVLTARSSRTYLRSRLVMTCATASCSFPEMQNGNSLCLSCARVDLMSVFAPNPNGTEESPSDAGGAYAAFRCCPPLEPNLLYAFQSILLRLNLTRLCTFSMAHAAPSNLTWLSQSVHLGCVPNASPRYNVCKMSTYIFCSSFQAYMLRFLLCGYPDSESI